MNILIADDEQHVREAIKLLVDWQALGVDRIIEAENGTVAIELAERYQPELIVTDMIMPGKNGIDFLEWLQQHLPHSKKIAVSGHDDFDFVRNTLKYGGMDYLLKPIDAEQLNETLLKAKGCWEREESTRHEQQRKNIEMNQLKPVYRDKIFSNLVTDPSYYASVQDMLHSEFGLGPDIRQCQIVIISLDFMERTVIEKFNHHRDLLFFSLTNICNEFLRKGNCGYACRYWNSENEIIILYWKRFERLHDLLAEINEGFYSTLRGRFDFGVGTAQPFPEGLGKSYKEAQTALRFRNMLENNTWLHRYEAKEKPAISTLQFSDFEEKFKLSVLSGKRAEIEFAVNDWIEAVKRLPVITVEQMELWRHEYHVIRSQWLKQRMAENTPLPELPALPIPVDEFGRLSLSLWQQELADQWAAFAGLIGRMQHKERNAIYSIAQYIEQNYGQEVTLQDIADRFYLSREYISRKFKQEFGVNIFDYLLQIRMDKAKILLQNPNLKITQIAAMVGYPDEKYFSKVFKKEFGQSPGQYRKGL